MTIVSHTATIPTPHLRGKPLSLPFSATKTVKYLSYLFSMSHSVGDTKANSGE